MASKGPVLIVGSGVGGLVLANALQMRSIPFRIFERDPSLSYRPQGYRFHLRPVGTDALYACLSDKVKAKLNLCSPFSGDVEKNAQLFDATTGSPIENWTGQNPNQQPGMTPLNLDRSTLRKVLSEDLPIEFNKSFESFATNPDVVTIHFADKTTANGSLIVGADGIRSRVRAQVLPEYKLLDTEGRWIWGKSDLTPELRAKLAPKKMDFGITGLRDVTHDDYPMTIITEAIRFDRSTENPLSDTLPPDYVYWVLQIARQNAKVDDETFNSLSSEEAAQFAASATAHLIPELRAIVEHHNRGSVAAQLVTAGDPEVPHYDGMGRVILMGDAIHSMPPTAGLGAAAAIQDAKWLADALQGPDAIATTQGLEGYEEKMRANGRSAIASSEDKSMKMFGAPRLHMMKRVSP